MFRGLPIAQEGEAAEWARKWGRWVYMFDNLRDAAGDYRHFPRAGGYYDQPAIVLDILNAIRDVYKTERKKEQPGAP